MALLFHTTSHTLFLLALFYKWFALDDRYAVFLYEHLGATPFDAVTTSRYLMAGLVACGAVMLLYLTLNFALARLVANYRAPAWTRVWATSALPLGIGIIWITTTQNAPTLSLPLALACALTTIVGLAFALLPGALAAENPRALAWLALDGFGLIPTLTVVRGIEMAERGLSIGAPMLYALAVGSIVFGAVWLLGTSAVRARRRIATRSAPAIFIAGMCWSYLALPLAHYLFATPANFKYITTASNFFAENIALQAVILVVAFLLTFGATQYAIRSTQYSEDE
jgi:hypothetical protein